MILKYNKNNNKMVGFVMETINNTLKHYCKKININLIELPKKLINDIVKRADNMSGCFCADYINHKIYTYLIEYAYDNNLECVDCYINFEDIEDDEDKTDTEDSSTDEEH